MTIRVVIADDHTLVREGFRRLLESESDIRVVGEVGDGSQAVEAARRLRPDVVLMDIRMPKLDGLSATRAIVTSGGATRVVILTTYDLDEYVFDALRAGASGFLLKDSPPDRLLEAVRVASSGEALLSPSITRKLIEEFTHRPIPEPAPKLETLTRRESDVLSWLARGLSNAEIAGELFISPATVKSHVASVLSKLELRDRVQAVVYAYEYGLAEPSAAGGGPPAGSAES
ncbi:MAG TPA: response regulator transcription factor [Acidimicrobiia bacterium]|nr:response regulator transcription factor [Acidimicrobiia bacterium]